MTNEKLLKGALMFGGGFLAFLALKPKLVNASPIMNTTPSAVKSFDSETKESNTPKPTKENAEIVAIAYSEAMKNGEPSNVLMDLNKECRKEYGMTCYMDKGGKLVVSDVSGNVILTK